MNNDGSRKAHFSALGPKSIEEVYAPLLTSASMSQQKGKYVQVPARISMLRKQHSTVVLEGQGSACSHHSMRSACLHHSLQIAAKFITFRVLGSPRPSYQGQVECISRAHADAALQEGIFDNWFVSEVPSDLERLAAGLRGRAWLLGLS